MVRLRGQSTTEFIVMLAILAILGVWIMNSFVGPKGDSGAVNNMRYYGVVKIAKEKE